METRSRSKLFSGTMAGVLTFAGVLFSGLGQTAAAQERELSPDALAAARMESRSQGLEGTWRVTVTQKVCATGTQIGLPFHSLLTFARGGTMTGTTANPSFQPGQRTGDYGVWSQAKGHVYTAIDQAFVIFTGGLFTQGSQIINHSISLTDGGNGFLDEALIQFYDVNGVALLPSPGCATAVGTRMQ